MKFPMDFAEALAGDVGVKFGGADARVAEHFLDDAQVSAVFEQMRREGMAEHVRGDSSSDAGGTHARFNAAPHCRRRESGAALG